MPEFENGPVTGFKVRCWFIVDGVEVVLCDHVDVPASKLGNQYFTKRFDFTR